MKKIILLSSFILLMFAIKSQGLYAQCNAPNYIQVEGEEGLAILGIKSDSTLWSWGDGPFLGQPSDSTTHIPKQIGTENTWRTVSGHWHSLAIKHDGSLWGWGINNDGRLGDGTTITPYAPIQIGTDLNWVDVATGQFYSLALKNDGTIWSWGANNYGQLGNGSTTDNYVITQIGTDTDWVFIETNHRSSFAIKSNGTLWAWGSNSSGQLGDGTQSIRNTPVQIGTDTWSEIACGGTCTVGIKNDSTLWAWGTNYYGQLGNGTNLDSHIPIQIGVDSWSSVDANFEHCLGIKNNGTLWAWGTNNHYQLGDNTNIDKNYPVQVGTDSSWNYVNAAANGSYAIDANGQLWSWGRHVPGSLGTGTSDPYNPVRIPTQLIVACCTKLNDVSCNSANGKAYAQTDYGTPPYSYIWRIGSSVVSTSDTLINANAGVYTVTVTDSKSYKSVASIEIIDLASAPSYNTISATNCYSYSSPSSNYTWTSSGTYTDTLINAAGCDSVITVNLTINNSTSNTISPIACNSFTSPSSNYTWTTSGTYMDTLINAAGCDSVITINLTVNNSTTNTISVTACDSYTSPSTNHTWTTSGTYTDTLTNASGCDSVLTINLTINNSPNVTISGTVSSICLGSAVDLYGTGADSYQWISSNTTSDTLTVPYYNASANHILVGTIVNGCTDTASVNFSIGMPNGQLVLSNTGNTGSMSGIMSNQFTHPNDGQLYNYMDSNCNVIVSLQEAMGGISLGKTESMIHLEANTPTYNGQPYIARWHEINPTNQGPATVTLYFTDQDFINYNANNGSFPDVATHASNATQAPNLAVTKVIGGTLGTGSTTVYNATGNWDNANNRWEVTLNTSDLGQFYLHTANPGNGALSVNLKSFTVEKSKEGGMLNWVTGQEKSNSHFEVERSHDGINFEFIGNVNSKAIDGTSSNDISYEYTDHTPLKGLNHYRLKQVDLDGLYEYSEVRFLRWNENERGVILYPNPNQGQFTVSIPIDIASSLLVVRVFDMSGRVLKTQLQESIEGLNQIEVSISDMSSGIYYVQVLEDSQLIFTSKIRKE